MKILIFTDPHIGLNRLANTTQASAQRLREAGLNHLNYLLTNVKQKGMLAFCLGDLFDQYSNDEVVIKQAMDLMGHIDVVLAGNHDASNRKDKLSSLDLLHAMYGDKVLIGAWGTPAVFQLDVGRTRFLFIPHVANQALFEEALTEAQTLAVNSGKWNVLCLHCNYDLKFEELQDTSLNLSKTAADLLLGSFHHVFIGHEHIPVEYRDGRIVIVGCTHPTGFNDISDKRVLIYDTESGTYKSQHMLSGDALLWKGNLSELPDDVDTKFLDLKDDLSDGKGFTMVNRLFKSSDVFAIRLTSPKVADTQTVATIESMDTLPEEVGKDLKSNRPELLPLWEELLAEAEEIAKRSE